MQRCRICPRCHDGTVRLLPAPVRYTFFQKHRLQFPLIAGMLDGFQYSRMRNCGDSVRFPRERDLILVFNNSAFLDSVFDGREVRGIECEEGDFVRDLVLDGPDGGRGFAAAEEGVDFGGGEDFVDVIGLQRFGGGEGETGPDYAVRVHGGDEEGEFGGVDVVGQGAVGEGTAGEVVEVAALSGMEIA